MARPHARPAPRPVRRRPAHLNLPRTRHRRRLLPQAPAPQPPSGLTDPAAHPKMTQQPQGVVPRSWHHPGPMVLANDNYATLAEIRNAQGIIADQSTPDLQALLELEVYRDAISHRNHSIPAR